MVNKTGLGVFESNERIFLFKRDYVDTSVLTCDYSLNGFDFNTYQKNCKIIEDDRELDNDDFSDFRISVKGELYLLSFLKKNNRDTHIYFAISRDIKNWEVVAKLKKDAVSALTSHLEVSNKYRILYTDKKNIYVSVSSKLGNWRKFTKFFEGENYGLADNHELVIGDILTTEDGVLLTIFARDLAGRGDNRFYAMLFDGEELDYPLWEGPSLIWRQGKEWEGESPFPLGSSHVAGRIISYWETHDGSLYALNHPHYKVVVSAGEVKEEQVSPELKKHHKNPVLAPDPDNFWESIAVFNPAAWYDREKVHLIYRAVGDDYTSVWGYAASSNGLDFDEREGPIYVPQAPFEVNNDNFCAINTVSGWGGGGGCEDPRMTKLDDTFYVIYVAYDGRTGPRLAMTSIHEDDFHNKSWNSWSRPVLISRPGIIDKSGSLLPEKIDGKYVIFHRVFPHILIDFVDSLDEFNGKNWLKGEYKISPREDSWDSRKVGVGATPIKTDYGWLVIYNAVDDKDDGKYLMGAMLLDLEDPRRVLYRSSKPILAPTEAYENHGLKYGVIYPCGAAVINDVLYVYYGSSDHTVSIAYESLPEFIDMLKFTGGANLKIKEGPELYDDHTYKI